jgi:hypothetical protein
MGLCLGREVEKETSSQKPKIESGDVPEYFPLGIDMSESSKNYRMRPMDTPELDDFIKSHKHKHKRWPKIAY